MPVIPIINTSLMTNGQFAYVNGPYAVPTDNAFAQSSQMVGAYQGKPGFLLGPGEYVTNAQFTTQGGKPYAGQVCWLANAGDDTGTGIGKLTATHPSRAISTSDVGFPIGFPFNYPKCPTKVFRVTDNTGYAATKTCKGVILDPMLEQDTPPSGTTWMYAGLTGFAAGTFISTAFNQTGATFANGEAKAITWLDAFGAAGFQYVLWQNIDAAGNGWSIDVFTQAARVIQWTGGAPTILTSAPIDVREGGRNRLVTQMVGGTIYACLNDGPILSAATAITPSGAGATAHKIGAGFSTPMTVQTFVNCAHLKSPTGTVFSPAEMSDIAASIIPTDPTAAANSMILPAAVTEHPDLVWWVETLVDPYNAYGPQGAAAAAIFAWTPTMPAPTQVYFQEQLYTADDLTRLYQATAPVVIDANGAARANIGAQIVFTAAASQQDIAIDVYSEAWDNKDQVRPATVWLDGAFLTSLPVGTSYQPTPPRIVARQDAPVVTRIWLNLNRNAGPPTTHTVEIRNGEPSEAFGSTGPGHHGAFIVGLVTTVQQTFTTPIASNKNLVLFGDIGMDGQNVTTSPQQDSVLTYMRADFPTAGGPGVVVGDTQGDAQISQYAIAGSMVPLAQRLFDEATHEGAPEIQIVLYIDGYFDYFNANTTPAAFGASYAALVDAINAICAAGIAAGTITSYLLFAATTFRTHWNAIPNGLGQTLAQFTAQITALPGGGHPCHVIDASLPAAPILDAGNQWLTAAGTVNVKANLKAHITAAGGY